MSKSIEASYPLSPMQKGLLIHQLFAPPSGVDIQQVIMTLSENLNTEAFEQAWQTVVNHHTILRTSFRSQGLDEPLQEVHQQATPPFIIEDWSNLSPAEQKQQLDTFIQVDRQRGFALDQPPLMRLALFYLGPARYQCLWTYHHILLDEPSLPLVLNEVFAVYEANCQAHSLPLATPIPYQHYIDWLQQQDRNDAEPFWRQLLEGVTAPTPFSVDNPSAASLNPTATYGSKRLLLSEPPTTALHTLAEQYQLPLNVLLQGTWALLLSRYSGEETVLFGASQTCRHSMPLETESPVGLFINTLPRRIQASPQQTLLAWLQELQAQQIAIQPYEHTPLSLVQSWSDIPSGVPFFESILVFEDSHLNTVMQQQGRAWVQRQFQIMGQTNYPLTLQIHDGDTLTVTLTYDQHRFDDSVIARMVGHLEVLLTQLPTYLEHPLANLSLLTDAERHQLLVEWNDTARDYAQDVTLPHLFEAQVARTPTATALTFAGQQMTYHELNQRANQLAHHLQDHGVGPEVLVGIFMERSFEMLISLYAIVKAGGAYVPLDPDYPAERVAFMMEEANSPVVLTQEKLVAQLPQTTANIICVDSDWPKISVENSENPVSGVTADNLAYVIFTSGSTGRPKGVMNTHKGICNRLFWMQEEYQLTPEDRVLQKTPFSFDVSVWEFFWPLIEGATLVIAQPEGHKDRDYLADLIIEQEITVLHFVPSMLQIFLGADNVSDCRSLQKVICSGEALPYKLQVEFFTHLSAELHNLYGPTEAAVDVTYWACSPDAEQPVVPIGRPVANTQIYILDPHLQPVPIGVPGELHIGGVQVARSYLNRPQLTAERFIADPFSEEPGARLYKTGDKAHYLPDGNIEYLGRLDFQVKIRGFRIELGEIETALLNYPTIREAIVLAREDTPGEKRLVAYLIPATDRLPSVGELRAFLIETLPDYMIPAAFVKMDKIPLNANGKVDRAAFPQPSLDRPELGSAYAPPQNEVEQRLTELWQETLGLQQIGIYDNFFELGGDSLKGAVLINKLQALLSEYIYIVALFDAPTIAKLATYLQQHYPQGVLQLSGQKDVANQNETSPSAPSSAGRVDAAKVAQIQQLVPPLPPRDPASPDTATKNSKAIFILSPPRSGTTLLRVVLGGHPVLFAPPELDLLCFNTLAERKAALTGGDGFRLTGTVRAIMDIKDCDADQAQAIMDDLEAQNLTVKQFYQRLQTWLAPRLLVDKTTFYPLDMETLKRADEDFEDALYIHLTRHPYGMIRSFEEVRADRIYFKDNPDFSIRETGELTWLLCQQNILEFLQTIPTHRHHHVKFEDLVNQPDATINGLCQFLGLELHPDMLQPYSDEKKRMTDGIHSGSASRMLGDVKFHEHQGINASIADRWQQYYTEDFLGDITRQVMETLGYDPPARQENIPISQNLTSSIQTISQTQTDQQQDAEALLAQIDDLSDEDLDALLQDALNDT